MYLARTFKRSPTLLVLRRRLHVSLRLFTSDKTTRATEPESAYDHVPTEDVLLDQNPHLKHAVSSKGGEEGRDRGHGNAADDPVLPSVQFENERAKALGRLKNAASGSENALLFKSETETHVDVHVEKHATDVYAKEVDSNPPASSKTHRVDGDNDGTHRPNEQYAEVTKEYTVTKREVDRLE